MVSLLVASACGASSESLPTGATSDAVACAELDAFTAPGLDIVAAEDVQTPKSDATHPITGQPLPPLPAHCKVTGTIEAEINFELHLPLAEAWNGRFAMLADWVEKNEAPTAIVAEKHAPEGGIRFTRRLCPYPTVAEYDGQGDPADAASYRCASAE